MFVGKSKNGSCPVGQLPKIEIHLNYEKNTI